MHRSTLVFIALHKELIVHSAKKGDTKAEEEPHTISFHFIRATSIWIHLRPCVLFSVPVFTAGLLLRAEFYFYFFLKYRNERTHRSVPSSWCGHPRSRRCRMRTWTSWSADSRPGRAADTAGWWWVQTWRTSGTHWCQPVSHPAGGMTRLRESKKKIENKRLLQKVSIMKNCFALPSHLSFICPVKGPDSNVRSLKKN